MTHPEVTVIMPVFNGEKYIEKSIASVLSQTFNNFEFLIVNDGSTDKTAELIHRYEDHRIRLICNESNRGITYSLNKGLETAQGDYVARIDSNDLASPDRLKLQMKLLRQNPEVALIGSSYALIDDSDKVVKIVQLPTHTAEIKWRLLFQNCIPHSSAIFKKDIVMALGCYDESFQYAQDYDLWMRISERHQVASIDEPLLYYRLPGEGSISHEKKREQATAASLIHLRTFQKIGIDVTHLFADIDELGEFLFYNGTLRNPKKAGILFNRIFQVFHSSSFCAGLPREEMIAIQKKFNYSLSRMHMHSAWESYHQNNLHKFRHCILKSMRYAPFRSLLHLTMLYLKSLPGKKMSDAISRIRKNLV